MIAPKLWLQKYVDLSDISDKIFAEKMTFAGNKIEAVRKIQGQTVYEMEITSNRPDTLSIIGLAREAAAVLNRRFTSPEVPLIKNISKSPKNLKIKNKKLCSTYSAVEIDNVTVKPSSKTIQQLLTLAELRPVNNIVDITNYMLWEHAQLMHTFDADKIKGDLNLRLAKPGESIITLDHKKRSLLGGEIIIEDQEKIIDVPGIMGGLNTEIDQNTKKVYLLVAIDNPVLVRRASKNLKLRSPSSTRSEKQLDLTQTELVAKRTLKLIESESGGSQSSKLVTKPSNYQAPTIALNLDQLNHHSGFVYSQAQVDKYLNSVFIKKTKNKYQPPPWRRDIKEPVDLYEEINRLHGFNTLPKTLPTGTIPTHKNALKPNWLRRVKFQLAALGYTETYSSTLISLNQIKAINLKPDSHLKVLHPMSKDYAYMRTSILESLYPLIDLNLVNTQNIKLFELGTVFYPSGSKKKLPDQPLKLGIIDTQTTYPKLKGVLDNLANTLGLKLEYKKPKDKNPCFHPSNQVDVYSGKLLIGTIGQLIHEVKTWALSVNISDLIVSASSKKSYPQLSPFQAINEDLTFTLPKNSLTGEVIQTIQSTHKYITNVSLTKTYQQNHTFNLTFESFDKQLSDKLIAPIRKKIVSNLKSYHSAKLVGKLN